MGKKILIAEDDKDSLFILNMILNEAGFTVEPLPEGTSIVDRKSDWPDLFILDKNLSNIDGITLGKYLKLREETKNIPIIMISSYHKLKKKAKDAGINDFIEKPFYVKDLLQTVAKYVHQEEN